MFCAVFYLPGYICLLENDTSDQYLFLVGRIHGTTKDVFLYEFFSKYKQIRDVQAPPRIQAECNLLLLKNNIVSGTSLAITVSWDNKTSSNLQKTDHLIPNLETFLSVLTCASPIFNRLDPVKLNILWPNTCKTGRGWKCCL